MDEDLKPVMVFVYGGSNQFGEAEPYNMSGLAAFHDVVAVNMNYRTGPLGWMAFEADVEDKKSTGNFGIMDIQSALRWVHREIKNFGGDPSRVLLHGQSSGGGLTELTGYISPASYGLLRAVVSESGGLGAGKLSSSLNNTRDVSKLVGCDATTLNATALKKCMQEISPLALTNLTYEGRWGPVVDGVTIPEDPETMLSNGRINPSVDAVVFGSQTLDGFLNLRTEYENAFGQLEYMSAERYRKEVNDSYGEQEAKAILKQYPPITDYPPHRHGTQANVRLIGQLASDPDHCGNRKRAQLVSKTGNASGFVYRFNYWYQSNPLCTAVPNYHAKEFGPLHQVCIGNNKTTIAIKQQ